MKDLGLAGKFLFALKSATDVGSERVVWTGVHVQNSVFGNTTQVAGRVSTRPFPLTRRRITIRLFPSQHKHSCLLMREST